MTAPAPILNCHPDSGYSYKVALALSLLGIDFEPTTQRERLFAGHEVLATLAGGGPHSGHDRDAGGAGFDPPRQPVISQPGQGE